MIYTTLKKIRSHRQCTDNWHKLLGTLGKKKADDEPLSLETILDSNGLDYTLWCLRSVPEHKNLWRLYAVWCARQVQHLMKDQRNIDALDAAERHANGQASDSDLAAAREAALDAALDAALAAAWDVAGEAARAAATDAAWDAAGIAAGAAAWAAAGAASRNAAGTAAGTAAWDAAWAAAFADAGTAAGTAAWDAARAAARAAQSAKLRELLTTTPSEESK